MPAYDRPGRVELFFRMNFPARTFLSVSTHLSWREARMVGDGVVGESGSHLLPQGKDRVILKWRENARRRQEAPISGSEVRP